MKIPVLLILLFMTGSVLFAQNKTIDSLHKAFTTERSDTGKIILMYNISLAYQNSQPDSALLLAQEAYLKSKNIGFIKGQSWALNEMAYASNSLGNFPKALEYYFQQIKIEETRGYADNMASIYLSIALLYEDAKKFDRAISYALKADSIINAGKFDNLSLYSLVDIGEIYEKKDVLDSALSYTTRCYAESVKAGNLQLEGTALNNLGNIYFKSKQYAKSFENFKKAIPILVSSMDYTNCSESLLGLAKIFEHDRNIDSAIIYAKQSFDMSAHNNFLVKAMKASVLLSRLYKENRNPDSAFAYQEIMIGLKDSIDSREKVNQFQNIEFNEELRVRELKEQQTQARNEIRTYALLGGIALFMVIAFLFFRNSRIRRNTNRILEKQKEELQATLVELKNTQAQLIQSEKMASLGELTAGIAHEIQNPLNFVNNFSEVNTELIAEMKDEIDRGNLEEAKAIANDISENGKKINHHGKRADAIVKGMLLNSRSGAGQKESTDINGLANEYLKLGYHGFMVKDKSFKVTMKTDFDEHIGRVSVVPQDISRVLLNLYNNAFYAVAEKRRSMGPADPAGYEPTVSVTSRRLKDRIEIKVTDNGNGIPQKILDKIFQPFFTTKPTGQGTGLGLSISYDIIKAHGGELKAESKEGEGAQFIIRLPLT